MKGLGHEAPYMFNLLRIEITIETVIDDLAKLLQEGPDQIINHDFL